MDVEQVHSHEHIHSDHGHGGHGHHHAHGHVHGSAFGWAVVLNGAFIVVELIAGVAGGSIALIADAGHNLGDVLALLLAWGASVLSKQPARMGFTYGFKSSSILAALANVALLWVALGAILFETIHRFWQPEPVAGKVMIAVAAAGIVINAVSALLFARGRKGDLNVAAAFQHLMADAAVSVGVVIAGVAVLLTGRSWIDPLASLLITLAIGWSSWGLLKDAARLALGAVPRGIDEREVRAWLVSQPGIDAVGDLHIWAMSTTETAITAHLIMPDGVRGDGFLHALAHEAEARFAIHHATFQVETGAEPCPLHHSHTC